MVVYKESQTLPEYSIWYKHSAQCRCTHCATVPVIYSEKADSCMRITCLSARDTIIISSVCVRRACSLEAVVRKWDTRGTAIGQWRLFKTRPVTPGTPRVCAATRDCLLAVRH